MGREIRRVALDFDWPLQKVWEGFLNPHHKPCPEEAKNNCHAGATSAGKWLDSIARLIALVGEEAVSEPHSEEMKKRGRIYPHPYLQEWQQAPRTEIPHEVSKAIRNIEPQAKRMRALDQHLREHPPQLLKFGEEMAVLVKGLAGGRELGMGAGAAWEISETLKKAAGITDENWGICPVCKGEGMDPAVKEVYDAWKETPPPEGPGYQLWETVSEGSPVSPVFPTEEKFIEWLLKQGYSEKAARNFCKTGWAPSGIIISGGPNAGFHRDIESAALQDEK